MNLLFLTFIPLNILLENLQLTRAKPLHGWKNFGKKLFSSTNSLSGRLSLIIDKRDDQPEAKRHLRADVLDGSQDVLVRDQRSPRGAPVRRLDQRGELVEKRSRRKVVETDHVLHLRSKKVIGQWDMS